MTTQIERRLERLENPTGKRALRVVVRVLDDDGSWHWYGHEPDPPVNEDDGDTLIVEVVFVKGPGDDQHGDGGPSLKSEPLAALSESPLTPGARSIH